MSGGREVHPYQYAAGDIIGLRKCRFKRKAITGDAAKREEERNGSE